MENLHHNGCGFAACAGLEARTTEGGLGGSPYTGVVRSRMAVRLMVMVHIKTR